VPLAGGVFGDCCAAGVEAAATGTAEVGAAAAVEVEAVDCAVALAARSRTSPQLAINFVRKVSISFNIISANHAGASTLTTVGSIRSEGSR
jgi:hypothetical protein